MHISQPAGKYFLRENLTGVLAVCERVLTVPVIVVALSNLGQVDLTGSFVYPVVTSGNFEKPDDN